MKGQYLNFNKIPICKEEIKINVKMTTRWFIFARGMKKHFKQISMLEKLNSVTKLHIKASV